MSRDQIGLKVGRMQGLTLIVQVIQVALALVLLNVWLLRFNKSTPFRGGNARTMPEEFMAYGLPPWSAYVVGGLKIVASICLLVGLWIHSLVLPAAAVIAVLMVGALAMHLRIRDAAKKSVPALVLLVLSVGLCAASLKR